jgi:hypothetical protein
MARNMLTLETVHGVMFCKLGAKRPTPAQAATALEQLSPVVYAKQVLGVQRAADSTTAAVLRYLEAIKNG